MRTPALLAVLAILAVSFAGCSDDGDGEGDGTSSSSSSSESSTSTSASRSSTSSTRSSTRTSTGPAPNQAPTGSLSAAVNGTNATFKLTGSDPDKDALVWDLSFGDGNSTNGTTLPANVTHTYVNRTGNLTANFTVTDGKNPVTYNVTITLGGAKDTFDLVAESTGLDPTAEGTPIGGCLFTGSEPPSLGGNLHTLEGSIDGWLWTLTATYHAWFLDADLAVLGDGTASGTVPAGTTDIAICTSNEANAPTGSYTFAATEP